MKNKMNTDMFIRHLRDEYKDSMLLPDLAEHTGEFFSLLRVCFGLIKEDTRKANEKSFVFMGLWKYALDDTHLVCSMNPDHTTRLMCSDINSSPDKGYVRLINIIAKPPMFIDYLDKIQTKALSMPRFYPVILQYKPDLSTLYQLVFVNLFDLMLRQGVKEFVADGLGVFNLVNVKHGQAITFTVE